MGRHVMGMLMVLLAVLLGCAAPKAQPPQRAAPAGWQLVHPPEVRDDRYPRGYHIQSDAPLNAWQRVAAFQSAEDCESSRLARIDDTIDEARAVHGDNAKYELPVRRAVNARCVPGQ